MDFPLKNTSQLHRSSPHNPQNTRSYTHLEVIGARVPLHGLVLLLCYQDALVTPTRGLHVGVTPRVLGAHGKPRRRTAQTRFFT